MQAIFADAVLSNADVRGLILSEMFVHGDKRTAGYLIAVGADVWLLPADIEGAELGKLIGQVTAKLPDHPPLQSSWTDHTEDLHGFTEWLRDNYEDVLHGWLDKGTLQMSSGSSHTISPTTSQLVRKTAKAVGLRVVMEPDGMDGDFTKVGRVRMSGHLPRAGYHGTATRYLPKILRLGLRAGRSPSNYGDQGIEHPGIVFLSARFDEASHHAVHTAHGTRSKAVVVEFGIPDESLLLPDYDVDSAIEVSDHYGHIPHGTRSRNTSRFVSTKSFSGSREVGTFGYGGSIMPKFIQYVYILRSDSEGMSVRRESYLRMRPGKAARMLEDGWFD